MNNAPRFAVGLDLGGTALKAALVDRRGAIVERFAQPCDAARGPDAVIADLITAAQSLVARTSAGWDAIVGLGVGSPGPLSPSTGRIARMANLPGWNDVPLRDRLRDALRCEVFLDNDANLAAYGEYWMHRDRHPQDLVLLTLGTGVGFGAIVNGKVFHGHFENAAELGHMIVVVNGLACPCGQRGCLEQYASASAIARRAAEAIRSGQPSSLSDALRSEKSLSAELVELAARQGDPLALRIWDEACLYLAVAVINLQHAFNPARLLFGGGLSRAGSLLLDPIRRHVAEQRWSLFNDLPELALANLGYDAGVIGAAALAWEESRNG